MEALKNGKSIILRQFHQKKCRKAHDGLSPLGLRINVRNNAVCVTALEINGLAEEAGLMLGDKVIAVDNGAINTDIMSVASGKLEKYIQQADGLTLEIERNGKILMFDIAKERKPTQ